MDSNSAFIIALSNRMINAEFVSLITTLWYIKFYIGV